MGLTVDDVKRIAWTALQAFLATFLTLAVGALQAPNFDDGKAAVVAAVVAGFAAALSAVKNFFTAPGDVLK